MDSLSTEDGRAQLFLALVEFTESLWTVQWFYGSKYSGSNTARQKQHKKSTASKREWIFGRQSGARYNQIGHWYAIFDRLTQLNPWQRWMDGYFSWFLSAMVREREMGDRISIMVKSVLGNEKISLAVQWRFPMLAYLPVYKSSNCYWVAFLQFILLNMVLHYEFIA